MLHPFAARFYCTPKGIIDIIKIKKYGLDNTGVVSIKSAHLAYLLDIQQTTSFIAKFRPI